MLRLLFVENIFESFLDILIAVMLKRGRWSQIQFQSYACFYYYNRITFSRLNVQVMKFLLLSRCRYLFDDFNWMVI